MKTTLRFMAVVCAVAGLTASASASDAAAKQKRQAAPLLYAVPAIESNDVETLEIRVVEGTHVVVRQTHLVGPERGERAAIDVLFAHPGELLKLRELESTKPGMLQIEVVAGDRVLSRETFASAEAKSGQFTLADAVGEIQSVAVSAKPKSRLQTDGVHPDPVCEERCNQDLDFCLNEWCDPRGNSCSFCHTWYWDCYNNCPMVCTDPKSVTTYYTETFTGFSAQSVSCRTSYMGKTLWNYGTAQYQVSQWERTTNCDNSYTDRFVTSYYRYSNCWVNTFNSCSWSIGTVPGPYC